MSHHPLKAVLTSCCSPLHKSQTTALPLQLSQWRKLACPPRLAAVWLITTLQLEEAGEGEGLPGQSFSPDVEGAPQQQQIPSHYHPHDGEGQQLLPAARLS